MLRRAEGQTSIYAKGNQNKEIIADIEEEVYTQQYIYEISNIQAA
jgi:hypothetical protein